MKHAAAFLVSGIALWWLWMLLAGEWNHTEWIAAAGAAVVAAGLGEVARTRARADPGLPRRMLVSIPAALGMVLVDFAVVMWALAIRRRGAFVTRNTDVAGDEQTRAWATYLASISPNAYPIDIDPESGTVLTHHLVPLDASKDPL